MGGVCVVCVCACLPVHANAKWGCKKVMTADAQEKCVCEWQSGCVCSNRPHLAMGMWLSQAAATSLQNIKCLLLCLALTARRARLRVAWRSNIPLPKYERTSGVRGLDHASAITQMRARPSRRRPRPCRSGVRPRRRTRVVSRPVSGDADFEQIAETLPT